MLAEGRIASFVHQRQRVAVQTKQLVRETEQPLAGDDGRVSLRLEQLERGGRSWHDLALVLESKHLRPEALCHHNQPALVDQRSWNEEVAFTIRSNRPQAL